MWDLPDKQPDLYDESEIHEKEYNEALKRHRLYGTPMPKYDVRNHMNWIHIEPKNHTVRNTWLKYGLIYLAISMFINFKYGLLVTIAIAFIRTLIQEMRIQK